MSDERTGESGLFPVSLRYGIVQPDGSVYCRSFGFNCVTIPVTKGPDRPKVLKFAAPGERSKMHDPGLDRLAEQLNTAIEQGVEAKGDVVGLRVLLLDEGLCLTWDTGHPELEGKTPDEINQVIRQGIPIAHMTARERSEIFDI